MPPAKSQPPPIEPDTTGADSAISGLKTALATATPPAQPAPPPGAIAVRLTIRPDTDHYVSPSELPQLRAQGLLIEDPAPSGATAKAGKDA